ncbi:EamA family transporter [Yersinia proxima]|uniref:EamA family transporter n=1 Tax=Yersinia proxima TaxID=2890316 RepID=UPI0011158E05
MTLIQFFIINIGAIIAALGGIFLKRLSTSINTDVTNWIIKVFFNINLWLGGLCYILPIFLWAYLLRSMDLTKLQPLLSMVYIYTVVFAYFVLHEQPSLSRIIGIAIIMLGVVIVSRN